MGEHLPTGANRARESHIWERDPHDFYVEEEWCSQRLFEVEPFQGVIWDPACGMGRIVERAELAGLTAFGTDLVDRGGDARCHALQHDGTRTYDFLAPRPDHDCIRADNIVTNPPFDLAKEFALRALELARHKVAIIFPTARLNAARWLEQTPLERIWLLTPRPSMPPGEVILRGEKPGGGKMDYCWLVFDHAHIGSPGLHWLHRAPFGHSIWAVATPPVRFEDDGGGYP